MIVEGLTEDGALYKWTAESKTSQQVKQSAVNSLNAQEHISTLLL